MWKARKFYLFTGKAENASEPLLSFDASLFDAGVGSYNLVKVSSIRPPCFQQSSDVTVPQGDTLFAAYTSNTKCAACIISSAVGVGIPADDNNIGVIMKYSCDNTKDIAEEKVREMVLAAMALRGIQTKDVLVVSAEAVCSDDGFSTTLAGVALW